MHQRCTFLGGQGGSGVQDVTPPLLKNKGANKLSKRHSLIFSPILCKSAIVTFTQRLKRIDSNNFTLSSMFSSMFSFQNVWPIKRKAVHTLVLFHIFIHFLVACKNRIRSQLSMLKVYSFF